MFSERCYDATDTDRTRHYSTLQYNQSLVKTYDFAKGGATIDREVVNPVFPTANTFGDQIEKQFLPNYSTNSTHSDWLASNSLFIAFFGIMDMIISFHNQDRTPVSRLLESYEKHISQLYDIGARNFLILNIPPMSRPYRPNKPGVRELAHDVDDFNSRLGKMRSNLYRKHNDLNMFLFDTHGLFNKIMEKPATFKATSKLTYTKAPCPAYDLYVCVCPSFLANV